MNYNLNRVGKLSDMPSLPSMQSIQKHFNKEWRRDNRDGNPPALNILFCLMDEHHRFELRTADDKIVGLYHPEDGQITLLYPLTAKTISEATK